MSKKLDLNDLLNMNSKQLMEIVNRAHPIDEKFIENKQFRGVDLSLPDFMHKLLWQEFRKTFYRDPETGILRGWNVKMEQVGWDNPGVPKRNKNGEALTFGHYHLLSAKGKRFPKGWTGEQYLDYGVADNGAFDIEALGYCPLVAVNEGDSSLLLGWEVFKLGPVFLPLRDFWALRLEGDIEEIV